MEDKVWVYCMGTQEEIGICKVVNDVVILPNSVEIRMEEPGYIIKGLTEVLCCEECGSTDIESKYWVRVNVVESYPEENMDDNWCNNCELHGGFISLPTFLNRKQKKKDEQQ